MALCWITFGTGRTECARTSGEMKMDRSEINRALAKAIAYKQCGKERDARQWARELIRLLELADILAVQS